MQVVGSERNGDHDHEVEEQFERGSGAMLVFRVTTHQWHGYSPTLRSRRLLLTQPGYATGFVISLADSMPVTFVAEVLLLVALDRVDAAHRSIFRIATGLDQRSSLPQ
jgi:hypothetical protein